MPLSTGLAPGTAAAIRRRYRAGYSIATIARELGVAYEEACWALYGREVRNEIVFVSPFHTRTARAGRPAGK